MSHLVDHTNPFCSFDKDEAVVVNQVSHNHRIALKYAQAGIRVFPASHHLDMKKSSPSPKKSPAPGFSWSKEASADTNKIDEWWGVEPDALVGVPVKQLNKVIFDADSPRDGRPDGVAPFQAFLESNGGLPKGTVIIKTQSNGFHYVLGQPEGIILGNGTGNLPNGVDVRGASGDGGYIIAPGTQWTAPDGSIREWKEIENSPNLIDAHIAGTIPVVPEFLVNQLCLEKSESIFTSNPNTKPDFSQKKSNPCRHKTSSNESSDEKVTKGSGDYDSFAEWADKADLPDEIAYILTALTYIKSDDRNIWLLVGGALFDKFGELGRAIWDAWSSKSSKFDSKDQDRTWKSFSRQGISKRSSIGSIITLARENGFEGRKYEDQSSFLQDNYESENDTSQEKQNTNEDEWDSQESNENNQDSDVWFVGDELPKQQPALVEGLIPNRGLCILGGQSGAGKTYIAAHLSTALASGMNFFGHVIPERAGVIYIAAEAGDTLPSRLLAARIGLSLEDKAFPVAVINCGIGDLSNEADLRRLIQKIKRLAARIQQNFSCSVRMVVVDTLSAAFSIKDENSAAEMAKLCRRLAALGACINAVTLAVHHYGKSSESGLRGSSSLRASADGVIAVLAQRDELNGSCSNRRLVLVKSRTGVEGITHPFDLESVEIGVRGFDSIVAAKVVPREGIQAGLERGNNRPYSSGLKRFISALEQALIDDGHEMMIWANGPIVRAVDREKVRKIFYANTPADGDPTTINNRRSKAFGRGYADAEKRNLAKCYEHNGVQLMWLLR